MHTPLSNTQRCLHQVPLREAAGLFPLRPCLGSPKSYWGAAWGPPLAKLSEFRASTKSMLFSAHRIFLLPPRATLVLWNRTRVKEGAPDPKDRKIHFQGLPPSPALWTHLFFPLHLALPGPSHGASLQGVQSPPASKASRPDKSHMLTATPSQGLRRYAFVEFCFLCYPGSPKGNKGWVPGISGPQQATSLCSDLREVPIKASPDSQASSWRKVKGTTDVHRAGLDTGLVTQRCSRGHTGLAAALSRAAAPDNKLSRKWTCPLMPRDSPESGHRHREAP